MLTHSQDFRKLLSGDDGDRIMGGIPEAEMGMCKQRNHSHSLYYPLYCTHSPRYSQGFTFPCLYGSEPLPSFVIPAQEVEADRFYLTGLSPFVLTSRYSVLSLSSCERVSIRETDFLRSEREPFMLALVKRFPAMG
jgi:hypothetical protein